VQPQGIALIKSIIKKGILEFIRKIRELRHKFNYRAKALSFIQFVAKGFKRLCTE